MDEDFGNGEGRVEIFVGADEVCVEVAVFHHPEGCEDHSDTEGYESEAADGWHDIVTEDFIKVRLGGGEGVIEALLLNFCEVEWQRVLEFFQMLVEGEVFFAKGCKVFVEVAAGAFCKDVFPDELSFQMEEHEAGEESVFRGFDEGTDLLRCAGEDGGELRMLQVHVLVSSTAVVGCRFVVEEFSEAVGEVAVVAGKGVGKGVTFGFEDEAFFVVIGKDLIDGCRRGVGRDKEHCEGRFLGLFYGAFLFVDFVLALLFFIFHHGGIVKFFKALMDGKGYVSAEVEAAFAGGCTGCDEEKEVWEDFQAVVFAVNVGKAGGNDHNSRSTSVSSGVSPFSATFWRKYGRFAATLSEKDGRGSFSFKSSVSSISSAEGL